MFEGKSVAELKALCKEAGIKGYSKLSKADLIQELLNEPESVEAQAPIVEAQAPIVAKGRSVGAATMAAAMVGNLGGGELLPSELAKREQVKRNKAKARRRTIRAKGGVAGWA